MNPSLLIVGDYAPLILWIKELWEKNPNHLTLGIAPHRRKAPKELDILPFYEPIQKRKIWQLIAQESVSYFVAIASPTQRAAIAEKLLSLTHKPCVNILAPDIVKPASTEMGSGIFIGPGSLISPYTQLEGHIYIEGQTYIGTHTHIDSYVTLRAGSYIGNKVKLEAYVYVGARSVIADNITIGKGSQILPGSVVLSSIPPGKIFGGNPAHEIRYS